MAFPIYTNGVAPAIDAGNLNTINTVIYGLMGNGVDAPTNDSDIRTNIGLGDMAVQNASAVAITGGNIANAAITGGSISGLTSDLPVADGGTGASTAAAALVNLGIDPLGFNAVAAGAQAIPLSTFTIVNFGTERFDLGSTFAASAWTPPAGRLVVMTASVSLVSSAVNTGLCALAIFKNGVEYARGAMINFAAVAGYAVTVSVVDNPNGTDVYTVRIFQNNAASLNTSANAAEVNFSGSRL